MNFSERVAKAVMESIFQGAQLIFSESQTNGECDFDIVRYGCEVAALEVTSSADQADIEFSHALTDPKKGGNFIEARFCTKSWLIDPAENANISRIRKSIDAYLSEVEKLGIETFDTQSSYHSHEIFRKLKIDLRIDGGVVTKWKSGTYICIGFPTRGGFVDSDLIATALEVEAHKFDNRQKLAATGRTERHLFVWVDSSNVGAWGPMARGRMPDRAASLPPEVTHGWLASSTVELDCFRLVEFTKEHGWFDHGYIRCTTVGA